MTLGELPTSLGLVISYLRMGLNLSPFSLHTLQSKFNYSSYMKTISYSTEGACECRLVAFYVKAIQTAIFSLGWIGISRMNSLSRHNCFCTESNPTTWPLLCSLGKKQNLLPVRYTWHFYSQGHLGKVIAMEPNLPLAHSQNKFDPTFLYWSVLESGT